MKKNGSAILFEDGDLLKIVMWKAQKLNLKITRKNVRGVEILDAEGGCIFFPDDSVGLSYMDAFLDGIAWEKNKSLPRGKKIKASTPDYPLFAALERMRIIQ